MKLQLLENYRFESQIVPNETLKLRSQEPVGSRVPDDGSLHTFPTNFYFPGGKITSIELESPQLSGTPTLSGFIRFFSESNLVGRLMPWSYKKDDGLEQMYPSDDVVTGLGQLGFNVKKCGVWCWVEGNKTIVRWRHFFRPANVQQNYALQYEFDCVIHTSGIIEFVYPSIESLYTGISGNVQENSNAGSCIGIRAKNDGLTLGDKKIQVIDVTKQPGQITLPDPENDVYLDEFLGGYRVKGQNLNSKYPYLNHTGNYLDWPGKGKEATIFRFIPPALKIRKILPRKLISQITQGDSVPVGDKFDDRKSLNFDASRSLTSPTNLPYLFGQGTTFKIHDFSEESDLGTTRPVHPRDIKNFLKEEVGSSPFNEIEHPEVDLRDTQFYLTGTATTNVGLGFERGLHQKEKFTYEFSIDHPRTLPGDRSSLFLYDVNTRTFHGLTSSIPDSTNPDNLWVNMFGDAVLFSAFGTQVFSVATGASTSPNRIFPESWERQSSLKPALESASRYDSEQHICRYQGREIGLGGREDGELEPIVFKNDFSAPFLLEKVCLEIPIEAGPGWFNGRTMALNYGNQLDESYNKYDAGGPCVTVGIIKESKNRKIANKDFRYVSNGDKPSFTNREVIASCALIPSGDNVSGYVLSEYNISRLSETDTAFNVQLVPSGFSFYSPVERQILSPDQGNSFTGSAKFNFVPQTSSVFYYSKASTSGVDNPKAMYDFGSDYVNIYEKNGNGVSIKLENFKLPSPSGVNLSDNRNVLGSNKVFYDDRFPIKSAWNAFDKYVLSEKIDTLINEIRQPGGTQPLFKPPVFYLEKEPLNFSDNYANNNNIHTLGGLDGDPEILPLSPYQTGSVPTGGWPTDSWEGASNNELNTNSYFNINVSNAGMVGIFGESPYLLMPGDRLSVFVSKHRPTLTKINSKRGGYVEFTIPEDSCSAHDIKIASGKLKLTFFGSYISKGKEWVPPGRRFECADRTVTVGDDPVLDQYEVQHDLEMLGTYSDNWIFPIAGTEMTNSGLQSPNMYNYVGVGEGRMRLYGSTYGKLQANFRDSNEGMET